MIIVEKTGMSEADALKNYDFDRDWVEWETQRHSIKYEPLFPMVVCTKAENHEISALQGTSRWETEGTFRPKECDKFWARCSMCKKCRKMDDGQKRAFLEDMYNAQWGVRGVGEGGGLILSLKEIKLGF